MMKYALVQFKDGKRNVKYLTLTKDIKGFQPSCAEDIPDREYMVKWQGSFDGEHGEHHDGCYKAKILLVGASPDEIKSKARELRVRLPPSFPPSETTKPKVAMHRPLRKQRKKAGEKDAVVLAKNQRMNETLNLMKSSREESEDKVVSEEGTQNDSSVKPASNQDNLKEEEGKKLVRSQVREDNPGRSGNSQSKKAGAETVSRSNVGSPVKNMYEDDLEDCEKKLDLIGESEIESNSEEDDATVILDRLKKEHALCDYKIEKLEELNLKLKSDLKTYKTEMQKKRETIKAMKKETEELNSKIQTLQQKLKQQKISGSREKQVDSCPYDRTSTLSFKRSSPVQSLPIYSPINVSLPLASTSKSFSEISTGDFNTEPILAKRSLFDDDSDEGNSHTPLAVQSPAKKVKSPFQKVALESPPAGPQCSPSPKEKSPSKKEAVETNGSDDLKGVTHRVFQDLKGEKPLEGDEERVYVGMDSYINKQFWEKTIRKQRDDSKFVKDCAHAVWGLEKLKVRTVERKSKTRPFVATPQKVNIVYAMLRGKLLARDLSKSEQDLIVQNAKTWLGQKMYDSGRPCKKPKD